MNDEHRFAFTDNNNRDTGHSMDTSYTVGINHHTVLDDEKQTIQDLSIHPPRIAKTGLVGESGHIGDTGHMQLSGTTGAIR